MEWMGLLGFIFAILGLTKSGNVETRVSKIEKKIKSNHKKHDGKELNVMSKILEDLVGKRCKLKINDDIFEDYGKFKCDILEVDEEWLKFSYKNKQGETKIRIIRIEALEHVDIL